MMRWWDNDVFTNKRTLYEDEILKMREFLIKEEDERVADKLKGLRKFTFRVDATTEHLERVAVTGSCNELGLWQPERLILLDREEPSEMSNVWSKMVKLPSKQTVEYRFVIVTEVNYKSIMSIRRWEEMSRQIEPIQEIERGPYSIRYFMTMQEDELCYLKYMNDQKELPQPEIFGIAKDQLRVAMGWLTTDMALHLKLHGNNIRSTARYPVNTKFKTILVSEEAPRENDCEDLQDGWPVIEVAVLDKYRHCYYRQGEYGTPLCDSDNTIIQIFLNSLTSFGIMIDFYAYDSNNTTNLIRAIGKPVHVGYAVVLPEMLAASEGEIETDICNVRGELIGYIKLDYAVITNCKNITCKFNDAFTFCNTDYVGIKTCSATRDNTLASIERTALLGYDYIEISVQFTKDGIAVFAHNPYIVVVIKKTVELFAMEQYQVRVEDLFASQLHKMAIFPINKCGDIATLSQTMKISDENNQPFPTITHLLNAIDKQVGFIIEVVTNRHLETGRYTKFHTYNVNEHVDVLLKTIKLSAGRRDIILTSCHPDVCSMMKLKQNKYPVIFLADGVPGKYPKYDQDVRSRDVEAAIHFAVNMNLYGLGVTEETLTHDDHGFQIQQNNLMAFCVNEPQNINTFKTVLKNWKLNCITCDRHDEHGDFRRTLAYAYETTENERNAIRVLADSGAVDGYAKPPIQPLELPNRYIYDLEQTKELPPEHLPAGLARLTTKDYED